MPRRRTGTLIEPAPLDLPDDWRRAIATIVASGARRVVVLGPTDVGKTSFIRALTSEARLALIDLDPGQKMIGPPGSAGRGWIEEGVAAAERWLFLGTTSAAAIGRIVAAARTLGEADGFVANTSGYVSGPGARLQAATVAALRADTLVAIGCGPPPLPAGWTGTLLPLQRSPRARRKSQAYRARIRQQAFERHLGAAIVRLRRDGLLFEPGPPAAPIDEARPLCSVADEAGDDMTIGLLLEQDDGEIVIQTAVPPRPIARLRLGRLWAARAGPGWRLLERQLPGWAQA